MNWKDTGPVVRGVSWGEFPDDSRTETHVARIRVSLPSFPVPLSQNQPLSRSKTGVEIYDTHGSLGGVLKVTLPTE